MVAVNSMRMEAPWSSVQITCSGLRISTSELASMSEALTGPGPSFFSTMRLRPSECRRSAISLMLRMMLVTSSRTPGIDENSCSTPSICTVVMAALCSEECSTRRRALPRAMPTPRSSGSATMVAILSFCRPGSTASLLGRIRSCQFLCRTFATLDLMSSWGRSAAWISPCGTPPLLLETSERPRLDAAALAGTTAVVGNGCHISDLGDLEPYRLQGAERRLAAGARAHHLDLQHLHAVLHGLLARVLGGHLGGVGGGLARPLEAHRARRRPGDGVALGVSDGDHGVVEARADMRDAGGDVLALATAGLGATALLLLFGHLSSNSREFGNAAHC